MFCIFATANKTKKIMKGIGYIYLTTNLVNGKRYVGQHLATEFDAKYKGSGTAVNRAFEKYGWDNFKCEVICWCSTQTQLNETEDNYIKLLGTMTPNGYNLRGGGSHGKHSKEARQKNSKTQKKRFENPEEREKVSERNKKYYENEENRKKSSEIHKKYYENEENRKKMSEIKKQFYKDPEKRENHSKAHDKQKKRVLQYTLDGVFVKEWDSLKEIDRVLGFDISTISRCCRGKRKSAYKHIWTLNL